ncbi:hypothetical protein [Tenacibaculum sp.]|uniref:hypothetical protein n=1 Tax=Tenacibaculum sp. TaxID=1906242 RepID=UPI003D14315E
MENTLKVTSWNVEGLDKLFDNIDSKKQKRIDAIKKEILDIDADVLCMLEGVKGEAKIDAFCTDILENKYMAVKAVDNEYKI